MNRILVTGSTGFVGSHLVRELRMREFHTLNISSSPSPHSIAIGDYREDQDWSQLLQQIDCVVHLAARAHVTKETVAEPLSEFRRANVEVTRNLAEQAASAGIRRFIFLSTIGVNGQSTVTGKPFTVNDPPHPESDYAIAKWEAEDALRKIAGRTGMDVVIIRPPLMYGAGIKANFRSLAALAASGAPSIFGGVSNLKSFLYVRNLCDLIVTCIRASEAANRTFLACDGHDVSTDRLYKDIQAAMGLSRISLPIPVAVLKFSGLLTNKRRMIEQLVCNLQIDMAETTERLGWTPPYSYDAGIREMAESFNARN